MENGGGGWDRKSKHPFLDLVGGYKGVCFLVIKQRGEMREEQPDEESKQKGKAALGQARVDSITYKCSQGWRHA